MTDKKCNGCGKVIAPNQGVRMIGNLHEATTGGGLLGNAALLSLANHFAPGATIAKKDIVDEYLCRACFEKQLPWHPSRQFNLSGTQTGRIPTMAPHSSWAEVGTATHAALEREVTGQNPCREQPIGIHEASRRVIHPMLRRPK